MGRRPRVFVRSVSMEEGRRLQRISRTSKDPVRLRRAMVVLMSAQGQPVGDITSLLQVGEDYVRDVIHAFNERGFDALDPKWSGGRPKTIGDQVRERICLIARTSPGDWGIKAFSTWSLAKLAEHLVKHKVVAALSRETLRRIVREGKVSWQTTTTWKASTDPAFITKMHRVLTSHSTARTTARTTSRTPPSPPTYAGTTPAPSRRRASHPSHPSGIGPNTQPRLRKAMGCRPAQRQRSSQGARGSDRRRPDRRGRIRGSGHQGTTPLSSNSWPVGPSSGRVASLMATAAPCSGVWVPLNPLRSVAT